MKSAAYIERVCSVESELVKKRKLGGRAHVYVQVCTGDSSGLVPDRRKVSHTNFWFPGVHKSGVYTVLLSINVRNGIMSKKYYTHLN